MHENFKYTNVFNNYEKKYYCKEIENLLNWLHLSKFKFFNNHIHK